MPLPRKNGSPNVSASRGSAHSDKPPFEEVLKKYRPLLNARVRRYCALAAEDGATIDKDDATARLQTALFRAWESYDPAKGNGLLQAWLKTKLDYAVKDLIRERVENRPPPVLDEREDRPSPMNDLGLSYDLLECADERAREDLETEVLDLVERRVGAAFFRARFVERMPVDKAARKAGITPTAARQRLARAAKEAREHLNRQQ